MPYTMKPLNSGTRMRKGHDVFAGVIIGDFGPADTLEGSEIWTAPADGVEVRKGDKWLLVTKRNGVTLSESGWTAYIHKGVPICGSFTEIGVEPPPPAPVEEFPQSFTLTNDSTGNKAQYVFVKVLSEVENTIRVSG